MDNLTLIKQYAETGAILPEYQFRKLNPNLIKTYIRRRLLQAQQHPTYGLKPYEWEHATTEQGLKSMINTKSSVPDRILSIAPEKHLNNYIKNRMETVTHKNGQIDDHEWKYIPKDKLIPFLNSVTPKISKGILEVLPKEYIDKYLDKRLIYSDNDFWCLNADEWEMLSPEKFAEAIKKQRGHLPESILKKMDEDQLWKFYERRLFRRERGAYIKLQDFEWDIIPPELLKRYLTQTNSFFYAEDIIENMPKQYWEAYFFKRVRQVLDYRVEKMEEEERELNYDAFESEVYELLPGELALMPLEMVREYFEEFYGYIAEENVSQYTEPVKNAYIEGQMLSIANENSGRLHDSFFNMLSKEQLWYFINMKRGVLTSQQINTIPQEWLEVYLDKRSGVGESYVRNYEYKLFKDKHFKSKIDTGEKITDSDLEYFPYKWKRYYYEVRTNKIITSEIRYPFIYNKIGKFPKDLFWKIITNTKDLKILTPSERDYQDAPEEFHDYIKSRGIDIKKY